MPDVFARRLRTVERPWQQFAHHRLGPWRPGHGLGLQEGVSDRTRLFVLALLLEPARFLRPLVTRRGLHRCRSRHIRRLGNLQPQQVEQRMGRI